MTATRVLAEADYNDYIALRALSLKTDPRAFLSSEEEEQPLRRQRYSQMLEDPFNFIVGGFAGERLDGMTGFFLENRLKTPHKGWIWGVYVRPEARGKSLGKAMMDDAIERAFSFEQVQQIQLGVGETNDSAIHLYKAQGFEPYGVERRAMKVGDEYIDEILMVLFRS